MAVKDTYNLINEVNDVAEEINSILNNKQKNRYFESIAVLYSFIEDILKWLVFIQVLRNKSENEVITTSEIKKVKKFCNEVSFYHLLNLGLTVGLLDYQLYNKIDDARIARNRIIHQYWLYTHKGKKQILRKKLEKLAHIANSLVEKLNDLVEQTGIDESYNLFKIKLGRHLIP